MFSVIKGNVVNGTIGKQMVDTLVESASNVEVRRFSNFSLFIFDFYAFFLPTFLSLLPDLEFTGVSNSLS
jgi:hypothetical protein